MALLCQWESVRFLMSKAVRWVHAGRFVARRARGAHVPAAGRPVRRAGRRDAHHLVEVIIGATTLRERLRDLQNAAREEILWFRRANPLAMQGAENTEEYGALSRGVRYRAIYERALIETPGELDSIAEGVSSGEEARVLPTLPVRLAIVHRSTAICPLVRDDDMSIGEPPAAIIGRA